MDGNGAQDQLTRTVIGAAIEVHKHLGPGLLERTYESCLIHELALRNMDYESQVMLPVKYKDHVVDSALKMDLIVNNSLILELKSVDSINEVHKAQLLTYLNLSGMQKGLIINFNVRLLKHGILRMVN